MAILSVNLPDWDTTLAEANGLPVLLDLWAPWCAPCKAQSPVLERLAGESAGRLRIAKLDVEANAEANRRFSVRGIPLLILFKEGKELSRRTGLQNREQLRTWLADERIGLGLASEEYMLKDPLRLGGAFHNDPELREFLLNRWFATADNGNVRSSRFPYWADGHGTASAALVKSHEIGMFEQVSGLADGFGMLLDFVKTTRRDQLESIAALIPAGADVRDVPLRLTRLWLADDAWNWPQTIGPDANQLRLDWLETAAMLLRRKPVPAEHWSRLADAAQALETDDPMLAPQRSFAKLVSCLSPLPASGDAGWSVLLAIGTYLNFVRAMYANGFTAYDLSFEMVRLNWCKANYPNPQDMTREEMEAMHRRFREENAELVNAAEQKHEYFYQNHEELTRPFHEKLLSHLLQSLREAGAGQGR